MKLEKDIAQRDFVQSLPRGLAVLEALSEHQKPMSVSEAADVTGMSRAAARRALLTLEALGYAGSEDGRFSLRPRVLRLGAGFLNSMPLWRVGRPVVERLVDAMQESCTLSVLVQGEVMVCVARLPAYHVLSVNLPVATRLPAYCTSIGRVLLAYLPNGELTAYLAEAKLEKRTAWTVTDRRKLKSILTLVREQGYSYQEQEFQEDVRSIAVPLIDHSGKVTAALNVSAHTSRISKKKMLSEFLPLLRKAADEIGAMLGAPR